MRRGHLTSAALVVAAGVSAALAGGGLTIGWSTIDGGGGPSVGGGFVLTGSIGQPDAGDLAGAGFTIRGGFFGLSTMAPPACPGDLNADGSVDSTDLNIVLGAFGCVGGCAGDATGDGATDSADLNVVLGDFGAACP